MEFFKRNQRPALLALLSLSLLFGGCASGGIFGGGNDDNPPVDNGDYDRTDRNDDNDRDNDRISEVRGRVDRVDTRDEIIYVEASGVYRSNLQNGSDQVAIHYDDQTRVEYDGKTYEPRALEEGDRVVVDVDDTGSRLYARGVEVTYDVTKGESTTADRDDDSDRLSELRGKVVWVDEDRRVVELEDTSWGYRADRDGDADRDDVIQVYYDSNTVVQYDGKQYKPGSLERGDSVEVDVRRSGSRYEADEIQVVENVRD